MDVRGMLRRATRRSSTHERVPDADPAVELAKYRYLLRVASPETFERIHTDAFSRLPAEARESLFRSLCRDLPEELRPISSDATDLSRAAEAAQDEDPGYLLRVLRRPAADPAPGSGRGSKTTTRYAASVLGAVAAAAVASPAATEALAGFDHSVEAAQVNPSFFVPRPAEPRDHGPGPRATPAL